MTRKQRVAISELIRLIELTLESTNEGVVALGQAAAQRALKIYTGEAEPCEGTDAEILPLDRDRAASASEMGRRRAGTGRADPMIGDHRVISLEEFIRRGQRAQQAVDEQLKIPDAKTAARDWIEATVRKYFPTAFDPRGLAELFVLEAEGRSIPIEQLIEVLYASRPRRGDGHGSE